MSGAPLTPGHIARRTPGTTRRLTSVHATVLRRSHGRLADRWFGSRLLVLETVGRRSGLPRSAALVYLPDGDDLVVVPANAGSARSPSRWLNLRAASRPLTVLSRITRRNPATLPAPLPEDLPMRRLRTLSSRRLAAIAAAVAVLAVTAGIAQAGLIGSDPKPRPKALDRAIVDAVNAPAPAGVSARITFTNGLLPSGSLPAGAGGPLAAGAEGRLWLAADGRLRLELQSDRGDAQIVSDGRQLSIYDSASETVYRVAVPQEKGERAEREPATLAGVRRGLERVARAWTLSGAQPTSTGGRPSYTLRVAPKDDGGLLGAGELAWDAEKGVPLRAAVYAQGQADPVLELEATDVSFGPIAGSNLRVQAPADAKVVQVDPPAQGAKARGGRPAGVTGVDAVQRRLDFELSAPGELAGLPRKQVRLVRFDGAAGALSAYGEGLGGILVLQRKASTDEPEAERDALPLPQVNIDGATGTELATALGTVVTFERGGVSYTVLGSVPPVAAENAARDLR